MSRVEELARTLQELLTQVALMTEEERERYMGNHVGPRDKRESLLLELRLMQRKIDLLEERM